MRNTGLEAQAGIKIASRNINNLRRADDTTLMAESKDKLKTLFSWAPKSLWTVNVAVKLKDTCSLEEKL